MSLADGAKEIYLMSIPTDVIAFEFQECIWVHNKHTTKASRGLQSAYNLQWYSNSITCQM